MGKCVFKKRGKAKIITCTLDNDVRAKLEDRTVIIIVTNGNRELYLYYSYAELQSRLTEYMNGGSADESDPMRCLRNVIERECYYILENTLNEDLFPVGVPWLEEASLPIQDMYYSALSSYPYVRIRGYLACSRVLGLS